MEKHGSPKTAAARRNEPKLDIDENPTIDYDWVILWAMQMGFSYKEAWRLEFGRWSDLFETYKKIHNLQVTQTVFPEPRKVESIMAVLG